MDRGFECQRHKLHITSHFPLPRILILLFMVTSW